MSKRAAMGTLSVRSGAYIKASQDFSRKKARITASSSIAAAAAIIPTIAKPHDALRKHNHASASSKRSCNDKPSDTRTTSRVIADAAAGDDTIMSDVPEQKPAEDPEAYIGTPVVSIATTRFPRAAKQKSSKARMFHQQQLATQEYQLAEDGRDVTIKKGESAARGSQKTLMTAQVHHQASRKEQRRRKLRQSCRGRALNNDKMQREIDFCEKLERKPDISGILDAIFSPHSDESSCDESIITPLPTVAAKNVFGNKASWSSRPYYRPGSISRTGRTSKAPPVSKSNRRSAEDISDRRDHGKKKGKAGDTYRKQNAVLAPAGPKQSSKTRRTMAGDNSVEFFKLPTMSLHASDTCGTHSTLDSLAKSSTDHSFGTAESADNAVFILQPYKDANYPGKLSASLDDSSCRSLPSLTGQTISPAQVRPTRKKSSVKKKIIPCIRIVHMPSDADNCLRDGTARVSWRRDGFIRMVRLVTVVASVGYDATDTILMSSFQLSLFRNCY